MKPTFLKISKTTSFENPTTANHIGFSFKTETKATGEHHFKIFSRSKNGFMKQMTNNTVRANNRTWEFVLPSILIEGLFSKNGLRDYLARLKFSNAQINLIANGLKDSGFIFTDDLVVVTVEDRDPSKGGFVIMVERDGVLAPSSSPKVHKTESLAMEELNRLSRLYTGQNFYMLKIVKCANVPPAPTVTIKTF